MLGWLSGHAQRTQLIANWPELSLYLILDLEYMLEALYQVPELASSSLRYLANQIENIEIDPIHFLQGSRCASGIHEQPSSLSCN